jgi:hypothetical protein
MSSRSPISSPRATGHTPYNLPRLAVDSGEDFTLGFQLDDLLAETDHTLSDMLAPDHWDAGTSHTIPANSYNNNDATQPRYSTDTTCIALATKTLATLHVCAEVCLSSPANSPVLPPPATARTTDAVLTHGAAAAATVSDILRCGACCSRPQLQLLVAATLERLADWYAVMARGIVRGSGGGGGGEERVLRQPITIGEHWIDGALEVPIMAHVILRRLQELEGLVEMLSGRMRGEAVSGYGPAPPLQSGDVGLPAMIHDGLIGYLRSQLRFIREELACLRESSLAY